MNSMLRKLPIVAVFGQGSAISADRARLAHEVGALVAGLGAHLLTGGGFGAMEAAAEGFVGMSGRAGLSIGVVPRDPDGPFDVPGHDFKGRRYPNPFVEIAIMTPLPALVPDWRHAPARNHVNVLTADAIIALPGNDGTRNELDMAAEYAGEADRPREQRRTILIGPIEQFTSRHRDLFVHAATLDEAEMHLRRALATRGHELGKKP
jgi:uncharacterized protein (TIGR00725 family)